MDSRRAPQLVVRHGPAPPAARQLGSCHTSVWLCARPQVQWYQRPGLEALADMPSSRSDELVWVHPDPEGSGISWDTQWASSMRHEQVRVILAYSMRDYPTESFPEGGKNVFACYRKWVPGETAAAPLERADVDRAKPVRNEEDDLRWALTEEDNDDDDDDPGAPKPLVTPFSTIFLDFFPFSPGLLAVFSGFLASRR